MLTAFNVIYSVLCVLVIFSLLFEKRIRAHFSLKHPVAYYCVFIIAPCLVIRSFIDPAHPTKADVAWVAACWFIWGAALIVELMVNPLMDENKKLLSMLTNEQLASELLREELNKESETR